MRKVKTKICTKCGEEKFIDVFYFRKDTRKYRSECKICFQIHIKLNYRKECSKRRNIRKKNWRKKNREHVRLYDKKWREANLKKWCSIRLKYSKKMIKTLTNTYVKQQLCQRTRLCYSDIPNCMVKVKRIELKFKRYLRRNENGQGKEKHGSIGREN